MTAPFDDGQKSGWRKFHLAVQSANLRLRADDTP